MADREKMMAYSFEALVGRLFTDKKFIAAALKDPEAIAISYNLGAQETKGLQDILKEFESITVADLAKSTVASGYGCSGGGDT